MGAVRQLSDHIGQDLCLLMSWAGAGADFSVKDNQGVRAGMVAAYLLQGVVRFCGLCFLCGATGTMEIPFNSSCFRSV